MDGLPALVATDLDGTLVRRDETVSDYSVRVLRKVREAGIIVVGVTGRGPRLRDLCRIDLPEADFFILAQGGFIVDERDRPRVLRRRRIGGARLAEVIARLEREVGPLAMLVEVLDGASEPLWGDSHVVWPYPNWEHHDRADSFRRPAYKGFARASHLTADELLAVARRLIPRSLASVTQAGLGYIEITAPGVDKGTGLAFVAQRLGIDPRDVVVFGDMPNDAPMFAWAKGRRVAVANAHPEVIAMADEVTGSNEDDGVATWLEAMLSQERH